MKVYRKFILATLAATAMLAGCTKETTPPHFENDKVNSEGSRVIAVSFTPQTKTTLDGFQPKFANKDSILISNGEALDTCEVKVDGKGATITTNLTGPLTAVYPYKAAKMSEGNENEIDTVLVSTVQSGKFADANICMAKMTSENDESLSFDNKTAVFCITPGAGESTQYVEVSADGFEIANNIPTGLAITDYSAIRVPSVTTDSVYVSILVPENLTVGKLTFSDGTNVKTIKDERASTAIAAGALYTVTDKNWESPEADIPEPLEGVFTVSDNGTPTDTTDDIKVHFSQGNLVATINATGTPTDWKFATNQYDYIGGTVANTSIGNTSTSGTAGDVDLFGWSTSTNGGTSTTDNYGIKTSTSTSDYSGEFYDWGKAIGDGNTWRTLSTAEWQYLFNSRSTTTNTGTTNARYAKATVNSKAGIILLPDAYTHPSVVTALTNINTNNAAFTVNTYDVTAWEAMESAGAVFLPAAGYRYGSYVYNVGRLGFYWSSTANGSSSAYLVNFIGSNVSPDYSDVRYNGSSVRLVTDVSAAPTPTEPDYVVITAKYDGEDNPDRPLKWSKQNLAITDSGKKSWKGGNTETAVKVPGTNEDVKVGDYFQWAAYAGYCGSASETDTGLLIYSSFNNTKCVGVTGSDGFTFKSAGESKTYRFNTSDGGNNIGISPYYSNSAYSEYTSGSVNLESSDDVASIILGSDWRMPTSAEFKALQEATYWAWEGTDQGYYVFKPGQGTQGAANVKAAIAETDNKADALLFFPAAGDGVGTSLSNAGFYGFYWSSSLYSGFTDYAYYLFFNSDNVYPQYCDSRYGGFSVRPVSD